MDILDVFFESGASCHAVLDIDPDTQQRPGADLSATDIDPRADLYAGVGDQHRGWFMSSLLCSIGMHNRAPFKSVATFGWTIDENGKALSKSMGSQISDEITGQLGAEIVRLWVASVAFREDVVPSLPLLRRLAEEIYRKLRNTFRFLLGSLREADPTTGESHDFDPRLIADGGDAVPFAQMQPIDQYILARAAELTGKIRKAYDEMEFHRVYHLLNEFCNSELSAFYLDVLKDRLYTYPVKFKPGHAEQERLYLARRSAQTAIYKITDALARLTAPILSFTADEVYQSLPHTHGSVHLQLFPKPEDLAPSDGSYLLYEWDNLLALRQSVLAELEKYRAKKAIGKSLEANVALGWGNTLGPTLARYQGQLAELLNVSRVDLLNVGLSGNAAQDAPEGGLSLAASAARTGIHALQDAELDVQISASPAPKCERCWRHVPDVGDDARYPTVCLRCAEALDAIDFPPYPATVS